MNPPKRGAIGWADLGIAAKFRPVVVLSRSFEDSDYALVTVVPHTTSPRGSSYEVPLNVSGLKKGAFNVQGMFALPPRVFDRYVGTLSPEQLKELEKVVCRWLLIDSDSL
jgi:mRNA interferase MazF